MNLARARRPASLALVIVASVLLVGGVVMPGLVIGTLAVAVAWLRLPGSPPESTSASTDGA